MCTSLCQKSSMRSQDCGIYTLILYLGQSCIVQVGMLGTLDFAAGFYSYTGSARGFGGLKRVDRHISIIQGKRSAKRWHIDYLLPYTRFCEVFITRTTRNLECQIAERIGESLTAVKGFGCTDCGCASHLHYSEDLRRMQRVVSSAHRMADSVNAKNR
jgi:Uri superfamily endonuclease